MVSPNARTNHNNITRNRIIAEMPVSECWYLQPKISLLQATPIAETDFTTESSVKWMDRFGAMRASASVYVSVHQLNNVKICMFRWKKACDWRWAHYRRVSVKLAIGVKLTNYKSSATWTKCLQQRFDCSKLPLQSDMSRLMDERNTVHQLR